MSDKTTTPTNGKADAKQLPAPTAKIAPITTEVKKEEKPVPEIPPVEDRIHKVLQLSALVDKHETLLETKKKLKAFKLSTDGSRDTLRIMDSKGNEFSTSNSGVIADVLEVIKISTDKRITEVENQIRF